MYDHGPSEPCKILESRNQGIHKATEIKHAMTRSEECLFENAQNKPWKPRKPRKPINAQDAKEPNNQNNEVKGADDAKKATAQKPSEPMKPRKPESNVRGIHGNREHQGRKLNVAEAPIFEKAKLRRPEVILGRLFLNSKAGS